MNGISTSMNNAINSYKQTYRSFKPASYNTDSTAHGAYSKESSEKLKNSPNRIKDNAHNWDNANADTKTNNGYWANKRRYDGFDTCFFGADYRGIHSATRPANTHKVDFSVCESDECDERKKAKELAEAHAYFRRAARSNGYTVVQSITDKLMSFSIMTGKKSVIMIDPEFMNSIADNPDALKKYADEIENMKRLDKQFERNAQRQGKTVVSRGWKIEKDGSISSWSVVKTERKATKGNLEKMNEMREKILKKKAKQKKENAKLEEKRSRRKEEQLRLQGKKKSAMSESIKRKLKKVRVYDITSLRPKTNTNKKITSISISCGSSPSLLDKKA